MTVTIYGDADHATLARFGLTFVCEYYTIGMSQPVSEFNIDAFDVADFDAQQFFGLMRERKTKFAVKFN